MHMTTQNMHLLASRRETAPLHCVADEYFVKVGRRTPESAKPPGGAERTNDVSTVSSLFRR